MKEGVIRYCTPKAEDWPLSAPAGGAPRCHVGIVGLVNALWRYSLFSCSGLRQEGLSLVPESMCALCGPPHGLLSSLALLESNLVSFVEINLLRCSAHMPLSPGLPGQQCLLVMDPVSQDGGG